MSGWSSDGCSADLPEIEAVRRAIDASGRPMVLSLSPGETPLSAADHVAGHANMWRISDDFWDQWPLLLAQFERLANWAPHRRSGAWPDADMLPLGLLALGERRTRFTPDEQRTRSEEHTSELQSLMRISYAAFCLKKK